MGEFHCITSNCARVVYREYLPPSIRWRYEGEDWQEIIGANDYEVIEEAQQCPGLPYEVIYSRVNVSFSGGCHAASTTTFSPRRGWNGHQDAPFTNIRYFADSRLIATFNSPSEVKGFSYFECGGFVTFSLKVDTANLLDVEVVTLRDRGMKIDEFRIQENFADQCPDICKFIVYRDGEIVHQETRAICPEVEILPCRLSDIYQEIKIDKIPYLSAIQVLPYARDAEKINGIPYPVEFIKPIPNECLNIYRAEIFDPLPSGAPDAENEPVFADYITQICSSSSCPPPEYEVICDCQEECPPNTCSVICGNNICCYDSDGKAQKSIPLSDFFPNNTRG